jgi:hypothetical protein
MMATGQPTRTLVVSSELTWLFTRHTDKTIFAAAVVAAVNSNATSRVLELKVAGQYHQATTQSPDPSTFQRDIVPWTPHAIVRWMPNAIDHYDSAVSSFRSAYDVPVRADLRELEWELPHNSVAIETTSQIASSMHQSLAEPPARRHSSYPQPMIDQMPDLTVVGHKWQPSMRRRERLRTIPGGTWQCGRFGHVRSGVVHYITETASTTSAGRHASSTLPMNVHFAADLTVDVPNTLIVSSETAVVRHYDGYEWAMCKFDSEVAALYSTAPAIDSALRIAHLPCTVFVGVRAIANMQSTTVCVFRPVINLAQ